jgi:hypothetical protein
MEIQGFVVLLISIANACTLFFAYTLSKKLEATEDRLRRLERRVG